MNPEKWKKSTIVPIQKVSGTKKLQEFRPINILPAYLFADDTLLYIAADTLNEAVNRMNDDLVSLSQWFTLNKLKLNV
jgi:hypothetical protein